MNFDALLIESDPIRGIRIPDPKVSDAKAIASSLDNVVTNGLSSRRRVPSGVDVATTGGRRKMRIVVALVASAFVLIAVGVALPRGGHPQRGLEVITPPITSKSVWGLAGYITQPGWQSSSASGPLPTSQQDTLQLTCPAATTCYSTGVDNQTGTTQGVISVTRDGGATWRLSYAATNGTYFSGISCPSTSTCMAVGSPSGATSGPVLYRTSDGGQTWTTEQVPGSREAPLALSCSTTLSCTTIGLEETKSGLTSVSYFTIDGGSTWVASALPSNFQPSGTSQSPIECFANGHCIAAGSTLSSTFLSASMIYSVDGGATWARGATPLMRGSGLMSCANSEHCVSIESDYSTFETVQGELVTNDGGASWTEIPATGIMSDVAATAPWLDSISCPTTATCWASAHDISSTCQGSCPYSPDRAIVLATTDGGRTWTDEALPTPPNSSLQYVADYPVDCVSTTECRAVGTLELSQLADGNGETFTQQDVMLTLIGVASTSTSTSAGSSTDS